MNTLHFKYAVTVARTGSITQAAEELFMAQPNLSKAIRELEDSLGIEIFRRTPKGMVPTAQGEVFLGYAEKVLEQVERMEALRQGGNESQRFCLALPRSAYIATTVARLLGEQPVPGAVRIMEMGGIGPLREVQEGRADLGIVRHALSQEAYFQDLISHGGLNAECLWEYDARPTFHSSHPLAGAETITEEDLAPYPELCYCDAAGNDRRPEAGRRIYLSDRSLLPALLQSTRSYIWGAPLSSAYMELHHFCQPCCSVAGNARHRWREVLLYPKNQRLSPLYRRFIDLLYEERNALAFN